MFYGQNYAISPIKLNKNCLTLMIYFQKFNEYNNTF